MAEGELENLSREGSAGIAANEENAFVWSNLPKDVQLQVLSYLPIRNLCQMRCVCKEWRNVVHRRDFRSMYDMLNSSEKPSPAICYIESSYPSRLEWSSYDYAGKLWNKMSSFPSLPPQTNSLDPYNFSLNEYNLYSVGGLLCLYFWKRDKPASSYGVRSWLVWHPFRNKWKKLPPCKHKVINGAPLFVHAFVSDERAKTYKILMAHDPKSHRWYEDYTDTDRKLVTEIYDSATGVWTDGSECTFKSPPFRQYDFSERGVLCNGVIYFVTGSTSGAVGNFLLSYNIGNAQWHEEDYPTHFPIFEWDGRLMSITSRFSELNEFSRDNRIFFVVEWDSATRRWEDTGIEVPFKVRGKFQGMDEVAIVASGNHLVVTGYAWDESFKIAVYKRAENYWRLPPTGAFSNRLKPTRVEGVVLHQPKLDWRP